MIGFVFANQVEDQRSGADSAANNVVIWGPRQAGSRAFQRAVVKTQWVHAKVARALLEHHRTGQPSKVGSLICVTLCRSIAVVTMDPRRDERIDGRDGASPRREAASPERAPLLFLSSQDLSFDAGRPSSSRSSPALGSLSPRCTSQVSQPGARHPPSSPVLRQVRAASLRLISSSSTAF